MYAIRSYYEAYTPDSELARWAGALGVGRPRFASRAQPEADVSHPAIAVNLEACIQCTRCLRACREAQVNDVIVITSYSIHYTKLYDLPRN